ncbi:MAG: methyl-accepting chemotaxis protein [Burkholderiaceae bacterium]|jgi:twitching motility protein PilJ|nr:methyl-accepting chemotaxis protein [Burkholderiaceae bacterium]
MALNQLTDAEDGKADARDTQQDARDTQQDMRDTQQEAQDTLSVPSRLDSEFGGRAAPGGADSLIAAAAQDEAAHLPLNQRAAARQRRILATIFVLSMLVLAGMVYWTVAQTSRVAQQLGVTGKALMQSQRLAKSVSQAVTAGNAAAFAEVQESVAALSQDMGSLQNGGSAPKLGKAYADSMASIAPIVGRAEKNAAVVLEQQLALTEVSKSLRSLSQQSGRLLELAEGVLSMKLQQGAPSAEISAALRLVMLTLRMDKSTGEFLSLESVKPETLFLVGKDVTAFQQIAQGLLNGSQEQHLAAARDDQTRERLTTLLKIFQDMAVQGNGVRGSQQGLGAAIEAQSAIVADSEPLRQALEELQGRLSSGSGVGWLKLLELLAPAVVALLCAAALINVQLKESRQSRKLAEQQRYAAEQQQLHAKRINDANQTAIVRLMNELQNVAEGDLTQEATVSEDITGVIADSVNYTVEELRSLVGNVQSTVTRVTQTTSEVESTSTELLATSTEQLREIRETGQSMLEMAARINEVSAQAQESASVARQSLHAAASGLTAVQNTIGGMNAIRDQIQETSKRIKRLGESSQEIGEITELITDITEQTNVLALNAAIQAASAGEAGRGFSVVAEEVQRLAERSGDATRQIAALVKAIQTDTQDAVLAMERSTQGVVEGARLSDDAGAALTEIDRVARRLAELIEQISGSALKDAYKANEVAGNIQHIFAVTEQTGESTRTTAGLVRELAHIADELRQSVARFKIA